MRLRLIAATLVMASITAPCEARAQEATGPVLSFLNAVADNNRSIAQSLAEPMVSQVKGYGGSVNGGPHAGVWNKRVVDGTDTISATDAFHALEPCNFYKAGLVSPRPDEKSAWVYYRCPDVVAVIFYVGPSRTTGKVKMYAMGRYLITASGLMGWEASSPTEGG